MESPGRFRICAWRKTQCSSATSEWHWLPRKLRPGLPLGTLILAAQFIDLLWPIFLLLGLEHVRIAPGITKVSPFDFYDYPISHSLLMVMVWSVVLGGLYYAFRPDLPLWPGGPRVGLGLWNSWAGSISAELLIFGAGLWAYLDFTRARDSVGGYAFWALMALLFFGWVSTLFAGAPSSITAMAWGAMTMWLTVPWAWWADAHRQTLTGSV